MNYLIIGNSSAAIGCVEGIRKIDTAGTITIISDESYHTYSRPLISYWLEGKVSDDKIFYRPEDFYKKHNCNVILSKKVIKIDKTAKEVTLEDDSILNYDKLLIATGSRAFVPPMGGLDTVKNKFTFMKYDDARAVKEVLSLDSKVLIIGAGLIGLKAAEGVYKMTKNITVVDLADRILPSILDHEGSNIVQKHLESKGVHFILNDKVSKFTSNTALLDGGTTLTFDILVVAVGVRPNTELASECGLEVNRGIIVDDTCMTSDEAVYAAGDCCESFDVSTGTRKILALLPNAYMQGEAAGINMAGGQKNYENAIPMNAIGFFGLHMITAGNYEGEAYTLETESDYKKLVYKDGLLKGYIMIGDVARAGIYTSIIKEQIPLSAVDSNLLFTKPQMMLFGKTRRLEKLGGVKVGN
ncbi:NAD(P)/FAD-dependent oxidoreductase [Cellulosilyticum sp. I15G10I2]|uniref:NAD(P)/FAD-dependent oxidoreductase n=1 Tax=Cellulosilyticum sp. I15G10I2 TaxID=1892843 RepID=UPI00085C2587|nr:FAD-dependent oxidoreductase [Cellulosilyticum sp. I15G10I2]